MNEYYVYMDDCQSFLVQQGSVRAAVFVRDAVTELDDETFFKDAESLMHQVSWWSPIKGISCMILYRNDKDISAGISTDSE